MNRSMLLPVCICLASLSLAACEHKGPAERAGQKVDHAADTIKNGGEEPTGDKLQDEAEKARDRANATVDKASGDH